MESYLDEISSFEHIAETWDPKATPKEIKVQYYGRNAMRKEEKKRPNLLYTA